MVALHLVVCAVGNGSTLSQGSRQILRAVLISHFAKGYADECSTGNVPTLDSRLGSIRRYSIDWDIPRLERAASPHGLCVPDKSNRRVQAREYV